VLTLEEFAGTPARCTIAVPVITSTSFDFVAAAAVVAAVDAAADVVDVVAAAAAAAAVDAAVDVAADVAVVVVAAAAAAAVSSEPFERPAEWKPLFGEWISSFCPSA